MKDPKKTHDVVQNPLGNEGVTDSPFDLPVSEHSYDQVRDHPQPAAVPTPTAPDDENNSTRSQTENMNDHIPQAWPQDF